MLAPLIWTMKMAIFLCFIMETVSGTSPANTCEQENIENRERLAQLQQYTEQLERKVYDLQSTCGQENASTSRSSTNTSSGSILIVSGTIGQGRQTSSVEQFGYGDCTELSLPVGRSQHVSGLTHDGAMLVCGGYTSNDKYREINDCINFNMETREWEFHSYIPEGRMGSSMVFTETGTYILGGLDSKSKESLFLPIGGSTWISGPEIPGKGVDASCAISVNSTHIMIIGGFQDESQVILWDINTNTWTQWPDLSNGVFKHACIMTEDGVMVTGGGGQSSNQTLIIDPKTGKVETLEPLVTPRYGHQMIMVEDKVMVVGGYSGNFESTEQYNGLSWEMGEIELDTGRMSFGMIIIPNTELCN